MFYHGRIFISSGSIPIIGNYYDNTSTFKGYIDDLQFYSKLLNESEIQDIYYNRIFYTDFLEERTGNIITGDFVSFHDGKYNEPDYATSSTLRYNYEIKNSARLKEFTLFMIVNAPNSALNLVTLTDDFGTYNTHLFLSGIGLEIRPGYVASGYTLNSRFLNVAVIDEWQDIVVTGDISDYQLVRLYIIGMEKSQHSGNTPPSNYYFDNNVKFEFNESIIVSHFFMWNYKLSSNEIVKLSDSKL